ncbi:MAG: bacteriohemerythrin [Geothrix sp.]|uniref:bacteriohemerythrin n=1 Tax=Geothrix sp. TaxID=1962974 RepID=UPI003BB17F05
MPIAVWNSRFETGVELIDAQHQGLFEAVNRLADSFKAGNAGNQVVESLDFLVAYTVEHFQTEERFMREDGFPGLAAHEDEHARLLQQVQELQGRLVAGQPVTMDVTIFLVEWLTSHISGSDLRYAEFVREKNRE